MELTSSAFTNGASIPARYTCDGPPAGGKVSPPLSWSGIPTETKSLALIMDDPDVPKEVRSDGVFDHWVLFNIPPSTRGVAEGESIGVVGANGAGGNAYTGPCPPTQYEPREHRYFFRLYALNIELSLSAGAKKAEVLSAMQGHTLMHAELMGRYQRQ